MLTRTQKNRPPVFAFVNSHANTAIHDFMNGALDVAKNAILSTTGQAISWDENGLRLRKWNSDHTGYEDEQIWMKDNLIVFTEDAWQHAKMAIGHIHDNELGDLWGVIADSIVGKLLAGENLIIMGTDSTGKKTLFRVDGSGMYAYNSRFWMESANGGAFAVDPSFGLGLGQGNPFTAGSDGTIIPKCIDPQTGALKLDKDGFPVGMNFWAGMDGQLYIRGKVFATGGEFTGVVKAQDFLLPSGDTMVSILNRDKKIKSDWLDLMGINIKNDAGQTVMTIDQTGVRFGSGYSPIKTRYSTNKNAAIPGSWSETWDSSWTGSTSTEVWAIYSYDGGVTWSDPQLAQGKTGSRGPSGSDANVTRANIEKALRIASSISSSYIGVDSMGSPEIYGGKIYGTKMYANEMSIFPENNSQTSGGLAIYGRYNDTGDSYKMFQIKYGGVGDAAPYLTITAPSVVRTFFNPSLTIFEKEVEFSGSVDFRSANVTGLHATFA